MPQRLFSSSRAMGGIYRAIVVEPVEDSNRIGATIYIPSLHRQQMPFDITGDTPQLLTVDDTTGEFETTNGIAANGVRLSMRKQDYPFAPSAGWWARPQMQTGDTVFIVFENADSSFPVIVGKLGSQLPLQLTGTSDFANGTLGIGEYIDIPEQYGTVETYEKEILKGQYNSPTHGWASSSLQGKLRKDAIPSRRIQRGDIFGLFNCAIIDNRLAIATKPNIGNQFPVSVGDYLDVSFQDGSVWNCILGDVKGADAGNPWGHDEGKSVVEIIYWDYTFNSGNQHKKVTRITKVGNYWGGIVSSGSPSSQGFIWPISSSSDNYNRITAPFGPNGYKNQGKRTYHDGIDIGVKNQPVFASKGGTIRKGNYSSSGYGNWLEIDHGSGVSSRYAHLSQIIISSGQVRQGQKIGVSGNTGGVTGYHLHFEIQDRNRKPHPYITQAGKTINSYAQDPLQYVNKPK